MFPIRASLITLPRVMYVSIAEGPPRLRNDLCRVDWDVKLYYTIPYLDSRQILHMADYIAIRCVAGTVALAAATDGLNIE